MVGRPSALRLSGRCPEPLFQRGQVLLVPPGAVQKVGGQQNDPGAEQEAVKEIHKAASLQPRRGFVAVLAGLSRRVFYALFIVLNMAMTRCKSASVSTPTVSCGVSAT